MLSFPPGTRVHTGFTPNFNATRFVDRYGPGAQIDRGQVGVGHLGSSAPEIQPDSVNHAAESGGLPKAAKAILARLNFVSPFTRQDATDMAMCMDGSMSYAYNFVTAIRAGEEPPGGVVVIPPPPANVPDDPEHQHSAKLPPGWKRDVMYVEETCNTEIAKGIQQLEREGVLTTEEAAAAIKARLDAVLSLHSQVEALPEDFNPGNPDNPPNTKGQTECDALYVLIHDIRRRAAQRRMNGYVPSAHGAYLGEDSFFRSQANEHLKNGLTAMSRVALSLGLLGQPVTYLLFGKPVESRASEYVLGFISWEAQDPIAREFAGLPGGSGGLNVGGR